MPGCCNNQTNGQKQHTFDAIREFNIENKQSWKGKYWVGGFIHLFFCLDMYDYIHGNNGERIQLVFY